MTLRTTNQNTRRDLELSFESGDPSLDPSPRPIGTRSAYYYLVNIDEYPEMLPLAQQVVAEHIQALRGQSESLPADLASFKNDAATLPQVLDNLRELSTTNSKPWDDGKEEWAKARVLHYFTQFTPTALVDACWMRCAPRVPTAHTEVASRLTRLYAHAVRVRTEDPGRHFIHGYRELFQRLASPLQGVTSRSFVERSDLLDFGFELPVLLLSIGQFPRSYLPELLGLNLSWHYLDNASFGPAVIRDTCVLHSLPLLGDDLGGLEHAEQGRTFALEAAEVYLRDRSGACREESWRRLWCGLAMGTLAWGRWLAEARDSTPRGAPDPRSEMIELMRRKAPHAHGYHTEKRIGADRIDNHLNPDRFDPSAVLDHLAGSPFIVPGKPDESAFVQGLVQFGGPMIAIFSAEELETVRSWISSLSPSTDPPAKEVTEPAPGLVQSEENHHPVRRTWSSAVFSRRSRQRYAGCTIRELYYHLVNVEFFPDVLPVAKRFAQDWLERTAATNRGGVRPLPCPHYDQDTLQNWVYAKHRQQVDSYRPWDGAPRVSKEAFIDATAQLAPLILLDGSWIQGVTNAGMIHTSIGGKLFHIFYEEVGLGDAAGHHANIYRELLSAMGVTQASFDSMDFALSTDFRNSSFDVPVLWLCLSYFPRHFLPEILGLNMAVELAGLGGPYLEARDTLRHFGFPSTFVDLHNAADNVSVGHAAWALDAIQTYMDEVAAREGPHNLDLAWRRVWTGIRSTLPRCSRVRLIAHRVARRLFGGSNGRQMSNSGWF